MDDQILPKSNNKKVKLFDVIVFSVLIFIVLFINFALLIYSIVTTRQLKKKYDEFMTRLGNGENITDMLSKYIQDVLNVSEENQGLKKLVNLSNVVQAK